ncbi:MAG: hypothetical protein ACXWCG_11760, partial [Flavitalea sp.]
ESNPKPSGRPVVSIPDTSRTSSIDTAQSRSGSSVVNRPSSSTKPYKFIFRFASKNYVIKRYNELKLSNPNIFWDTKDSITYRLYVAMPVTSSDTSRIRDSLMEWYGTRKIVIEQ